MAAEPDFYPMQSESHLDPAPRLAEIQETCPVTRVKIWNDMQPWLVTRYDDKIANRDPRAFPNSDEFDIHSDTTGHLAFGAGPHQCLGQHLARVRLQVVFDRLLERVPALRLVGSPGDVVWKDGGVITLGLDEMMVGW
jgi:hypothetical protein